jgi:hypothetical protein
MMLFGHQNDGAATAEENSFVVGSAPTNTSADNSSVTDSDNNLSSASLPMVTEGSVPTVTSTPELSIPGITNVGSDSLSIPPLDDEEPEAAAPNESSTEESTSAVDTDLLSIKQEALQQLSPLVGHLDQTPEEKFRTTMMMIQSSDNHALIKDAYAAAQSITDDKIRAQALLDVINEINYFTQQAKK